MGVMLITGAVKLVTWPVTLVTDSYMCKNGGEAPEQDTVGASWRQGGRDVQSVGVYLMAFPSRT